MSEERKTVRAGLWIISFANIVVNLLSLARAIGINHYFGASNYGIIGTVYSVSFLVGTIFLDPDSYAGFFLPKAQAKSAVLSARIIWLCYAIRQFYYLVTGALIYFAAAPLAVLYGHPELTYFIQLAGIMHAVTNATGGPIQGTVTNALQMHRETMILMVLRAVGAFLAAFFCFVWQLELTHFLIFRIFENSFFSAYSWVLSVRDRRLLWLGGDVGAIPSWGQLTKEILSFSFPISISRNISQSYQSLLTMLMAQQLSFEMVGNIKLVYNLIERISTMSQSFLKIFATSFAKAATKESAIHRFNVSVTNMNPVYLGFAMSTLFFPSEVGYFFGGKDFEFAVPFFRDFSFLLYVLQVSYLLSAFLMSLHLEYQTLVINIARAILVPLFLLFILKAGLPLRLLAWAEAFTSITVLLYGLSLARPLSAWRTSACMRALWIGGVCLAAPYFALQFVPFRQVGEVGYLENLLIRMSVAFGSFAFLFWAHQQIPGFVLVRDIRDTILSRLRVSKPESHSTSQNQSPN